MDIKELKVLDKIVKATKSKLFKIYPNIIIGKTDMDANVVEVLYATGVPVPMEFTLELWKMIIASIEENPNQNIEQVMAIHSIKRYSASPVDMSYQNVLRYRKQYPDEFIEDLKSDEQYQAIAKLKADDGQRMYKYNERYITTIYAGLIPSTKKDKVSLAFYDIPFEQDEHGRHLYFLAHYIVNKGFAVINKYSLHRYFY